LCLLNVAAAGGGVIALRMGREKECEVEVEVKVEATRCRDIGCT
jgi:hypothetical protein